MLEGVNEFGCRYGGVFGGGVERHLGVVRGKFDGVGLDDGAGWQYVYVVAAVMVFRSINVLPVSSSRVSDLPDRRFHVDNDLDVRGRKWSGIVI